MNEDISKFLDNQARLKQYPRKQHYRHAVLTYLASKFDKNQTYTEEQVNLILKQWHTFNDHVYLRRLLIDEKKLTRSRDGRIYQRLI